MNRRENIAARNQTILKDFEVRPGGLKGSAANPARVLSSFALLPKSPGPCHSANSERTGIVKLTEVHL
jgi:hypothetical protein